MNTTTGVNATVRSLLTLDITSWAQERRIDDRTANERRVSPAMLRDPRRRAVLRRVVRQKTYIGAVRAHHGNLTVGLECCREQELDGFRRALLEPVRNLELDTE